MPVQVPDSSHSKQPLGDLQQVKTLSLVASGGYCVFLTEFLAQLESVSKKQTRELFDVISGTSSGALVAAALNEGVPASTIGEQFIKYAPRIYRKHPFPLSLTGNWFKSPYSQSALRALVTSLIGSDKASLPLNRVQGALLLPLWDLESHEQFDLLTESFTSDKTDRTISGQIALGDAVVASMASPGQFSPVALGGRELIDPSSVTSSVSSVRSVLEASGIDDSKLNMLSLTATDNVEVSAGGKQVPEHLASADQGLFSSLRFHKAVFDSMPTLIAARAAVNARQRLGDRFQEYKLASSPSDQLLHSGTNEANFEQIRQLAKNEFLRFSSLENNKHYQAFLGGGVPQAPQNI